MPDRTRVATNGRNSIFGVGLHPAAPYLKTTQVCARQSCVPSLVPQTIRQGPWFFYLHFKPGYDVEYSCSHCQLVCGPDFEGRKKSYNMITTSGVVVQDDVGVCRVVSPHEAKKTLAGMIPERRALHELLPQK
ncbi:MAG: hypothetical protein NTV68_09385, partial [Methanomicrobiales archaeon]|nr:hypothetical protein [Methanomicrobiales archaeon]